MSADAERLEGLARDYEHRVLFFAHKISRSYMMGTRWLDELESAGYFGLAKALANLRPGVSRQELSAYVSQRIVGAVIDEARSCITRHSSREVLGAPFDDSEEFVGKTGDWQKELGADPAASPEELVSRSSIREHVDRVLDGLDADQERLLRLYMDGASLKEIASSEGLPLGTLRVRFQKITRQVRARAPEMRRLLLDRECG